MRVMLPGLAAIQRAADEDAIACRSARPIVGAAELVKSDVTQNGVAGGIICHRDVAGDAVILWRGAFCDLPCRAAILRLRGACGHLPCNHSLLRILWVHGDCGLVEIAGRGRYVSHMGVRRLWQWLRKCCDGADKEQQNWDSHKFEIATHSK